MMTHALRLTTRTQMIFLLTAGILSTSALRAQLRPVPVALDVSSSVDSSALPEAPTPVPLAVAHLPGFQSPGSGNSVGSSFPSGHERAKSFVLDLLGPTAFLAPAFESGIDTVRPLKVSYPPNGYAAPGKHPAHGDVPEWGEGAQGYAKRYADRFGQGLVATTSRYALGEILRQDVTYHRCECSGILPRAGHALLGAYTARTRSGRVLPSLPALVSPFVGSEVGVAAWYPNRYNTSDALRVSLLNYIAAPFKNLYGEFLRK